MGKEGRVWTVSGVGGEVTEGCKIATTLVAQKLLVTNHWFMAIYTISCMEYMLYGQGWRSLPHI